MKIKDLKVRESSLINTHQNTFMEYGIAYKEIRDLCESFGGLRLSESILIDEMARSYCEKEKYYYDLTKKEKYLHHIKAASELFKKQFATFDEIYLILYEKNKLYSFDEAKSILKINNIYNKIKPKTLSDVLQFIELKYNEELK